MVKVLIRTAAGCLALLLFACAVGYWQLQNYLDRPLSIETEGLAYTLERGGSLSAAAYSLSKQGVLDSPRWLTIYSRLSGRGKQIKAGDYWLDHGITPRLLLNKLESGDVRYFQVTLVEGWNLRDVLVALRSQPELTHKIASNESVITAEMLGVDIERTSLEGLIFPDTYLFQRGTSDLEILRRAYDRLQRVLDEEWRLRDKDLPYASPYEALTMASIIEKETGDGAERPLIAGVFVRRLQRGMRLQTDPTIIYGLGMAFDGNLRSRHLKDASNPYNTYRHNGLTPTPISLAGREAIHAALHPAEGDALYFVAKGNGSHHFSATLEEHQRAVRKYQINQRRKNYRSAPASKKPG